MEKNEDSKNGWNEWAKYVLKTLEKLEEEGSINREEIQKIRTALKIVQIRMSMRAALIGAVAGFLPAVTLLIYFLIRIKNGT